MSIIRNAYTYDFSLRLEMIFLNKKVNTEQQDKEINRNL
jgi:hypothetical protein